MGLQLSCVSDKALVCHLICTHSIVLLVGRRTDTHVTQQHPVVLIPSASAHECFLPGCVVCCTAVSEWLAESNTCTAAVGRSHCMAVQCDLPTGAVHVLGSATHSDKTRHHCTPAWHHVCIHAQESSWATRCATLSVILWNCMGICQ